MVKIYADADKKPNEAKFKREQNLKFSLIVKKLALARCSVMKFNAF